MQLAQFVGAVAAALLGLGALIRSGLKALDKRLASQLTPIKDQLYTNNGHSMRDEVRRIEGSTEVLRDRIEDLVNQRRTDREKIAKLEAVISIYQQLGLVQKVEEIQIDVGSTEKPSS